MGARTTDEHEGRGRDVKVVLARPVFWLAVMALSLASGCTTADTRLVADPNVIIIMPDDVSFDDFSFYQDNGPRTPAIDSLARESVRLTDFHVSPTCSPTRGALMTGRYNDATGVWHTILGRYFLRSDEVTMADVFAVNGYDTALIGKWHLGDNHPFRPSDRGFNHVVAIMGGGIDQQQNPWGNRDVPPSTIFVNDEAVPLTALEDDIGGGYSTDFFTTHAIDYLRQSQTTGKPVFLSLMYNVAHTPHDRPEDSRDGIDVRTAVIENLDKNVGRLLQFLEESGMGERTIVLFITDNGMANARFRGGKGSHYEGGHRVPAFLRWQDGGYGGTTDRALEVPQLVSHIDILPTLMDLLGLHDVPDRPRQVPIHGHSIRALLDASSSKQGADLKSRIQVVDNQRMDDLVKYKQACVMQNESGIAGDIQHEWRLLRESASKSWELYDLGSDAKQKTNIVAKGEHADVVRALESAYEDWWRLINARGSEYARPIFGSTAERETCLWAHDWHTDGDVPWNQEMVANSLLDNGFHAVEFARAQDYTFDLRRWPREIADETTLSSTLKNPIRKVRGLGVTTGKGLPIASARFRLTTGGTLLADEKQILDAGSDRAFFLVRSVPAGPARIQTWFYDADGKELCGAYYVYVASANAASDERPQKN